MEHTSKIIELNEHDLIQSIQSNTISVCVIGIGRIGLPTALSFANSGISTIGVDINSKLVQNIKLAETYTGIGTENVRPPRLPLDGDERKKVINIIESSLKNRPDLSKYTY